MRGQEPANREIDRTAQHRARVQVARQRAGEPCDEDQDVETEPHRRDDVRRHVGDELSGRHARGDALRETTEKRAIERVPHARRGCAGEHQLANEDARELRLRRVEREEGTEDVLGLGRDGDVLRHRAERLVDRARERVLEHERHEIFLRRRVEEQRSLRDAGALRDGSGRRRLEPTLDEERSGGLADPRALVLFVGFATHDC